LLEDRDEEGNMGFIVIFNIILYMLLFVWINKNMYAINSKPKVIYMVGMLIIIFLLTYILYNLGGNPIGKELGKLANTFNRTMIVIFTGINGLVIMPYIGLVLNKYKEKIIDDSGFKKRIIIIGVIFVVFLIFEFNYMKDMQTNMLEMINQK